MGRLFKFTALLIVVAIGLYVYTNDVQRLAPGGKSLEARIDVTAVRNDLMAIANAERRYWVTNGKYASIEELRANGDTYIPHRANYRYSAEVTDSGFTIVASYSGNDQSAPKRLSVDQSMRLTTD